MELVRRPPNDTVAESDPRPTLDTQPDAVEPEPLVFDDIKSRGKRSNDTLKVWKDVTGEWRWHRRAANNEIISVGGDGYKTRKACADMAAELNPGIEVIFAKEDPYHPQNAD